MQHLRMKSKLLLLLGFVCLVLVGISLSGWLNLNALDGDVMKVDAVDSAAINAAHIHQDVLAISRAEYSIASDPSDATLQEGSDVLEQAKTDVANRFSEAAATADGVENGQLDQIRSGFSDFVDNATSTYSLAQKLQADGVDAGEQQQVDDLVRSHEPAAKQFEALVAAYTDHVDNRGSDLALASEKEGKRANLLTLVAVGAALAITMSLGWLLATYGIARPLAQSVRALEQLAAGNLDIEIAGTARGDECGDIAKGLLIFRDNGRQSRKLEAEAAHQKEALARERRDAMLRLADEFEKSVGGIVTLVSSAATEMQAAATQLTATAQETSAQSFAVSSAAEEAGANVTSVAGSAEELGASISEIGRQVATSSEISQEAVRQSATAAGVVSELNAVASGIGDVVDMIARLAAQTNLLALNATIESARAGEAGKGFSVVASEVKTLAAQTKTATDDISARVSRIQQATGRAVTAIEGISRTIGEISTTNGVIASAVQQQGAATHEIVQAVSQVSAGTAEVTSNIASVAQAAEETGEAAAQVLSASGELAGQAERLHSEMERFLSNVRAA